jgi:hypothetical protein
VYIDMQRRRVSHPSFDTCPHCSSTQKLNFFCFFRLYICFSFTEGAGGGGVYLFVFMVIISSIEFPDSLSCFFSLSNQKVKTQWVHRISTPHISTVLRDPLPGHSASIRSEKKAWQADRNSRPKNLRSEKLGQTVLHR